MEWTKIMTGVINLITQGISYSWNPDSYLFSLLADYKSKLKEEYNIENNYNYNYNSTNDNFLNLNSSTEIRNFFHHLGLVDYTLADLTNFDSTATSIPLILTNSSQYTYLTQNYSDYNTFSNNLFGLETNYTFLKYLFGLNLLLLFRISTFWLSISFGDLNMLLSFGTHFYASHLLFFMVIKLIYLVKFQNCVVHGFEVGKQFVSPYCEIYDGDDPAKTEKLISFDKIMVFYICVYTIVCFLLTLFSDEVGDYFIDKNGKIPDKYESLGDALQKLKYEVDQTPNFVAKIMCYSEPGKRRKKTKVVNKKPRSKFRKNISSFVETQSQRKQSLVDGIKRRFSNKPSDVSDTNPENKKESSSHNFRGQKISFETEFKLPYTSWWIESDAKLKQHCDFNSTRHQQGRCENRNQSISISSYQTHQTDELLSTHEKINQTNNNNSPTKKRSRPTSLNFDSVDSEQNQNLISDKIQISDNERQARRQLKLVQKKISGTSVIDRSKESRKSKRANRREKFNASQKRSVRKVESINNKYSCSSFTSEDENNNNNQNNNQNNVQQYQNARCNLTLHNKKQNSSKVIEEQIFYNSLPKLDDDQGAPGGGYLRDSQKSTSKARSSSKIGRPSIKDQISDRLKMPDPNQKLRRPSVSSQMRAMGGSQNIMLTRSNSNLAVPNNNNHNFQVLGSVSNRVSQISHVSHQPSPSAKLTVNDNNSMLLTPLSRTASMRDNISTYKPKTDYHSGRLSALSNVGVTAFQGNKHVVYSRQNSFLDLASNVELQNVMNASRQHLNATLHRHISSILTGDISATSQIDLSHIPTTTEQAGLSNQPKNLLNSPAKLKPQELVREDYSRQISGSTGKSIKLKHRLTNSTLNNSLVSVQQPKLKHHFTKNMINSYKLQYNFFTAKIWVNFCDQYSRKQLLRFKNECYELYRHKDQFCKVKLFLKLGGREIDITKERDYEKFFCERGVNGCTTKVTVWGLVNLLNDHDSSDDSSSICYKNNKSLTVQEKFKNLFRRKTDPKNKSKNQKTTKTRRIDKETAKPINPIKNKCILPWFSIPITVLPTCRRYSFLSNVYFIVLSTLIPLPFIIMNGLALRLANYLFLRKVQKQNIFFYLRIDKEKDKGLVVDPPGGFKEGRFQGAGKVNGMEHCRRECHEKFPSLGMLSTYAFGGGK